MSGFNEKGIKNLSLQRRLNALGPQIAFLLNITTRLTTLSTDFRDDNTEFILSESLYF